MTMAGLATVSRVVERAARELGLDDLDAQAAVETVLVAFLDPAPLPGLTMMQSKLLQALQGARGRVLTREALLVLIGSDSDESVVDVQMSLIRRVRPDLRAQIETVRCMRYGANDGGFRWVEKEVVHG